MTDTDKLIDAWKTIGEFCDNTPTCDGCFMRDTCFIELTHGRNMYKVTKQFIEEVRSRDSWM